MLWFHIYILYVSKCACLLGESYECPAKHLSDVIWDFFPPTATLLTVSGLLQECSKSICLTFVHNIWSLEYSAVQLINNATSTHVFPFTTRSKGTHHPACYYPAPSTTMSPFFVISSRGANRLFSMNRMKCGQTGSIVKNKNIKENHVPAQSPNSIKQNHKNL